MGLSHHDTLVLLGLLVGIGGLVALSPLTRIPYPIFLVLGGLALGFVPGLPQVTLRPEWVLVGILPALLYASAFFTSLRDLRRNMRSIGLLAIGLVAVTVVTVALVAHAWIGLPWAAAFVLGAVVAPTDPLAASAIFERLGIPRRLVTLIEGESLVNDATALVAYRVAIGAVVTGTVLGARPRAGLRRRGRGRPRGRARRRLPGPHGAQADRQPAAEVTIALLTGYLAYLPAELLGASAVLAAVTAGVYLGWHTPELTTPESRLTNDAVWRDPPVHPERAAVRARRAAAARDRRLAERSLVGRRCCGDAAIVAGGGGGDAHRLDVPGDVRAAHSCSRRCARAIRTRPGSRRPCSPGRACAEPCRSPPRSRSRS